LSDLPRADHRAYASQPANRNTERMTPLAVVDVIEPGADL
jgi:hypothetical protein